MYVCMYVCVISVRVFHVFSPTTKNQRFVSRSIVSRLEELLLKGGGQPIQRQKSAQEKEALTTRTRCARRTRLSQKSGRVLRSF